MAATSAAVTIPLQINTEGTTITGIAALVSQGNKQEYNVTATGCALNTALTAGTVCNVTVTFAPGYAGQRPVPLQVASSAGTFNFGLTGIGTAPQVALTPGIITTFATGGALQDDESLVAADASGGLAIDSASNVYAAMEWPASPFDPGELIAVFAAGTGVQTGTVLNPPGFSEPGGLALDSAGNLYAASPNYNCIYEIAAQFNSGSIVAGTLVNMGQGFYGGGTGGYSGDNGPAVNAQLNNPTAVAVDSAGDLYIADTGNNRIRKVTAGSGIITTVVGNGTVGYSGDNGPAVDAELNSPSGVAVDSAGDLYIADTNNNRIRKVAAGSGIVTTVAGNGTSSVSGEGEAATST